MRSKSPLTRIRTINERDGWAGFYGGVRTTMVGKALISGVSFGTNKVALSAFNTYTSWGETSVMAKLFAASLAEVVAVFLVVPVGECNASESLIFNMR